MTKELKAPFPYFGGKSAIASLAWQKLGNCENYIEPFYGAGAVLLARPHAPTVETCNDLDSMIANFWRATQHDPEAVASYADGPVNEVDLHSRHRWLVLSNDAAAFRERMRTDPDYYDAKVAGWWCWGMCCWIGSGWCDSSQLKRHAGVRPDLAGPRNTGDGLGVLSQKRPRAHRAASSSNSPYNLPGVLAEGIGSAGWRQRPVGERALSDVHADGPTEKRPILSGHAGSPGKGANGGSAEWGELSQQVPRLGARHGNADLPGVLNPASGGTCAARRAWLLDWFSRLRDRLRNVRVCCGDWSRVCSSESVTTRLGTTGVFLDPPYSDKAKRSSKLYARESLTVAHEVRRWCLERGADRQMRIVLAGYDVEHTELESAGWAAVYWGAQGGYGNRSKKGKANAKKETLWCSPHCVGKGLFDDVPEIPQR